MTSPVMLATVPVAAPRVVAASVVIPTIGRPRLLAQCLTSLAACDPAPAEVVVADQSPDLSSGTVADTGRPLEVRVVPCSGTGRGRAVNAGLRAARYERVLVVDDDMTVAPDWVGVGAGHLERHPGVVVTGRVLPVGDARLVPSTNLGTAARRYGRGAHPGVLYAGNMGVEASHAEALGAFDERIVPAAEDCDFSYRWLRSGRAIHFDPDLVVWHHDWRDERELRALYAAYARGQGIFYAKHLRRRDPGILRYVLADLVWALRSWQRGWRRDRVPEPIEETVRGLPRALVQGWRALGARR